MRCEEAQAELAELLTGPEDAAAAAEVEAHVAGCERCREERDALARALALVRDAIGVEGPPRSAIPRFEDVLAAARARTGARSAAASPSPRPARAISLFARAAALLLAALAGVAADRLLLGSGGGGRSAAIPPSPDTASIENDPGARRTHAQRPGGLAAGLAALKALR